MSTYSPMIQQYLDVKKQVPDALLLFRMGDFYELFFEDAKTAARELQITLTGRDGGISERIPMAGVPHHSVESYLARLVQKGYKVAICEQIEDPAQAKGIVRRELTRVLTPGTAIETSLLAEKKNNYLAALSMSSQGIGLAYADISTGEFRVAQWESTEKGLQTLRHQLDRLNPSEVLISQKEDALLPWEENWNFTVKEHSYFDPKSAQKLLLESFGVATLEGFGLVDCPLGVGAAGAILRYLSETFFSSPVRFEKISTYSPERHMILDTRAQKNLELVSSLREGKGEGTLLWVLDKTVTPMGARLLRNWLLSPLLDVEEIRSRQAVIVEWVRDLAWREEWVSVLSEIRDMERLISRVINQSVNGRELRALGESLQRLSQVAFLAQKGNSPFFRQLADLPLSLVQLGEEILSILVESPPLALKEGGLIRNGVNSELDELRELAKGGKDWILAQEQKERERTGIKSLKIGFNRTFGYYIEVTHANRANVPADYIRKQTLVNAERYITPELKEKEAAILHAHQRSQQLEYEIFCQLREKAAAFSGPIRNWASLIAQGDALLSLARVAVENRYTCPEVNEGPVLEIKNGRHPVVERLLDAGSFVPNDLYLDLDQWQMMILTGPNMAGKSTYMRQIALTVIMAQIGSFVPAEKATIGIVDRIFTRVGAMDDLAAGQSTFMVEMVETANILHNATPKSLILLDEVGRGTSTFDGLSIAWAISEYIARVVGAKTLFATHYHELTEITREFPQVKSCQMEVARTQERIVFLRKVIPGGASHSYGIEVAKLAGLPAAVTDRAYTLLREIERKSRLGVSLRQQFVEKEENSNQISFFGKQ